MPKYRVTGIDPASGFEGSIVVDAPTDREAMVFGVRRGLRATNAEEVDETAVASGPGRADTGTNITEIITDGRGRVVAATPDERQVRRAVTAGVQTGAARVLLVLLLLAFGLYALARSGIERARLRVGDASAGDPDSWLIGGVLPLLVGGILLVILAIGAWTSNAGDGQPDQ